MTVTAKIQTGVPRDMVSSQPHSYVYSLRRWISSTHAPTKIVHVLIASSPIYSNDPLKARDPNVGITRDVGMLVNRQTSAASYYQHQVFTSIFAP